MQIFNENKLKYFIKINLRISNNILTFVLSMIDIETGRLEE